MIVSKCRNCNRPVRENCRGIQCDSCLWWFHLKCSALSAKEYNYFATTHDLWLCLRCRNAIFPFNSLEDYELAELLVYNSNTDCLCSDKISRMNLESLPCFDLSTSINNNPNLSSIDIDLNLPSVTNFGYYSTHEFHSNEDIKSTISDRAFSALHFNIRSLSANFDDFFHMLSDMKYSFSVIGLSETKIKVGIDPFLNTNLPGYYFLSQPSMSNAGGVGFYIKDDLSCIKRDDFCTTTLEFESIRIKIEVPH